MKEKYAPIGILFHQLCAHHSVLFHHISLDEKLTRYKLPPQTNLISVSEFRREKHQFATVCLCCLNLTWSKYQGRLSRILGRQKDQGSSLFWVQGTNFRLFVFWKIANYVGTCVSGYQTSSLLTNFVKPSRVFFSV